MSDLSDREGGSLYGSFALAPQDSFRIWGYTLTSPQNLGFRTLSNLFSEFLFFP